METKICAPRSRNGKIIYGTNNPNCCYKTLPIEEFGWNDKSKGYRRYNCKSCRNKYCYNSYKRIWDKRGPEAKQRRNQNQWEPHALIDSQCTYPERYLSLHG